MTIWQERLLGMAVLGGLGLTFIAYVFFFGSDIALTFALGGVLLLAIMAISRAILCSIFGVRF